ncbi:NfeD family protein [Thermoproteus tenax]|uniref:NfeD-like C-terminal domain-containing protein n=1 Tax=Thermoproteus tenax (strain ATCC 35583 / DSM 2078 / JCM 9277 / NBRC 100435 / Kra 1) TaxID=768679 RepID=G4RLL9_THETK|nr:NfeD family protein [Thermoproteus tenax]CCC82464.1 conserved hypothetical protein [Thermoproteus tenax Kra 1]
MSEHDLRGVLHISSLVLLIAGVLLIALSVAGYIPPLLGVPASLALIGLYSYVLYARLTFRKPLVRSPIPVGERATVVEPLRPYGIVKVDGELWRAVCDGCTAEVGECVTIISLKNGELLVRKCSTQ